MPTTARGAHYELVDSTRMEDAAVTASRSAEALFGYLSRLDALRGTEPNLGQEALAERAAEAELHMRVVLSAGMDAFNELQDLGLLEDALRTTATDPVAFNEMKLTEAVAQLAETFRERIPGQRWDWLVTASRLVEGVEVRVETDGAGLRATVNLNGQPTVVRLDPSAPSARVSTAAFFSAGPDRVYVPASAIFASTDEPPAPTSAYDAAVGGMALTREWVYRHARNAAELGPPARTGGGPVLAVIIIVVEVVGAIVAVAAAIVAIGCGLGIRGACKLAQFLGTLAGILTATGKGAEYVKKQQQMLSYGSNPSQ